MATTPATQTRDKAAAEASLGAGSWLMGLAAVGFIGYAVIVLVGNFTDSFLDWASAPTRSQ